MLNKLKNRKESGFTIIEVLIVLAIAGLILLIVFLAVPNLQRNSRNTALKNDVNVLGGGLSEYASNNGGAAAGYVNKAADGTVTIQDAATAGATIVPTKIKVQAGTAVGWHASTTPLASGKLIDPAAAGDVEVYGGYDCSGNKSARAYCAIYDLESAGGLAAKGQDF